MRLVRPQLSLQRLSSVQRRNVQEWQRRSEKRYIEASPVFARLSPLRPSLSHRPAVRPLARVALEDQYAQVPLVFEVSTPIWSPLTSAAAEILTTAIATYVAVRLLRLFTQKYTEATWTSELAPDTRVKRSKTVAGAVLRSLSAPLAFFLPLSAILHCIRVLTCRLNETMQLCTTCTRNTLGRQVEMILDLTLRVLQPVDDFIGAVLKQVLLFAGLWFLVTFKNQYVTWLLEQRAKRSPALLQDYKRIVIPLNEILSWAIVGSGLVIAAGLAGWDIRPLVTFGGVSGIIVGLSAQSVLANMIGGINLILSRPFVTGDRVQIFGNSGSLIYNGVVERINPLRTIVQTDRNYPLALPNKLLADMVIGNESRFPTRAILPLESGRRINIVLKFGLEHFDKLDSVIHAITQTLEEFPGLNHGIPFGVNVGALSDSEVTLEIAATALKREVAHFGELRLGLMRRLKETLEGQDIRGYKLTF